MISDYYQLTKPGIIYGNLLTVVGGLLLASRWHFHIGSLLAAVVGTALVIGSACVFNNYIDRGIDKKMQRTRQRAMVTGAISARAALLYGTVLLILGVVVLAQGTNWLTLIIGLIAFVVYVAAYGLGKRRSVHGTIIGSVSGSAPLVAGYTTVTNRLDSGAWILFIIMTVWQMPHFYSIAMYRLDEYKAAGIPVLPAVKSLRATKTQILIYIVAFMMAVAALTLTHHAGYIFLAVMLVVSLWWLARGLRAFNSTDNDRWGRQMFGSSLIVLLTLSVMLSLGSILP